MHDRAGVITSSISPLAPQGLNHAGSAGGMNKACGRYGSGVERAGESALHIQWWLHPHISEKRPLELVAMGTGEVGAVPGHSV